ncbi:ATP-binding protein [Adlercreutzia equolifaciens]|uniref:PAS domain-containing hybrid sensor histidine kinase/response regulator n=1 Tax=Adlercreutzia equolifaciens TaxID=446660 RepID=UPI0023B10C90|nr:ATP-binding protein [Adlercreutzia equolifaciens]MDE8702025.1 ATP-binding protein [Adlercreutzia equolifaciens]
MYHSLVRLLLVGLSDEASRTLSDVAPLEAFTHEVVIDPQPTDDAVAQAQLIIADGSGGDARGLAEHLARAKSPEADLILIAGHDQVPELEEVLERLADLWMAPLTPAELLFHFHRWQKERKHQADAWETHQYLEATINSIPSLVWYKSDDGIHHKVNDAFCATVNKTKEQVQGRGHAYIWDVEADDPACIESERQVMESRSTIVSEETVQTNDGTRLLTTYKSPLYNIDGTVMGTVGVGIDVTQERAYENEIVEKNRTLEAIFTSMEGGVITHSIDGRRVLGVNKAALDILGYQSEDELLSSGFDMIAASVIPEDAVTLRESIATLKHVGDSVSTEYRVRHNNGDIVHVMGNVKLVENDGELMYQRFLLDYTDKKLEEVQKERHQRDLIQALSEDYLLVCSFNLDTGTGVPLRVSHEKERHLDELFAGDLAMADCLAAYIDQGVHEEDAAMLRGALSADNLREELADTKRMSVNYRIRRGETVEYCQATIVRTGDWQDSHDVVLGFRSVDQQTRDEMKKKALLEDALTQANKASAAKSAFLSNMSHDIRTPMNAIVGFTTLAGSRIDQPEKVREYLDKIQSSSTHLLNLINDILDMSHIESGKVSLDEQPCNLPALLEDLYSIIQAETSARQLYFSIDTENLRHPDVRCDKLRINQILLNLLGNALKFTNPGGFIKVKLDELDGAPANHGRYRFTVSDTGIGMSPEFVERIFDPFERERTSTISGVEGTGLGMAITKNLVDMMHGAISVESEKGKGTTFTIELTLCLANPSQDAAKAAAAAHLAPNHRMRGSHILLVDDNDLNREIAVTLLEDEGFTVECAVNGQQAVDMVSAASPDHFQLVLMDVQMPIMNGYEATRAIRKLDNSQLASIPILAMTADAFEEDRQKALRCGMDGHLTKPIEMEKLFEALNLVLA